MDLIKDAFDRVKEDIINLKSELSQIQTELSQIQISLLNINKTLYEYSQTHRQTLRQENNLDRQINKTDNTFNMLNKTDNLPFKDLKRQNLINSTGNKGVSTDTQTDKQTDTSTGNKGVSTDKSSHNNDTKFILTKLENIKSDLKNKIKKLTNQEMLVLSSIYQFEDQGEIVDYNLLSKNLNLSESSIRDYIQRIINKGIVLEKEKINNKKIILHIPNELRKLTSLSTLINLREL